MVSKPVTSDLTSVRIKIALVWSCKIFRRGYYQAIDNYILNETPYAHKIRELRPKDTFHEISSLRHQLAWLPHKRPNTCSCANILSQVAKDAFWKTHIKIIISSVHKGQSETTKPIQHRLDLDSIQKVVFLRLVVFEWFRFTCTAGLRYFLTIAPVPLTWFIFIVKKAIEYFARNLVAKRIRLRMVFIFSTRLVITLTI